MSPIKKAAIAEMADKSPGIASLRLLKKVSPPLSPKTMNIKNNPKRIRKAIINLIDHLPRFVFGMK